MSHRDYVYRREDKAELRKAWRKKVVQADEMTRQMQLQKENDGLEISQPNDHHEQEADAIARKVVSGDNNAPLNISVSDITNSPQTAQRKEDSSITTLMARSEGGALHGTDQLQSQLDSSKGAGQSLDDATKSEMETKMNTDLSDVKIHTDSKAHEMSEGINAKAFTHGQDIYFKQGNFDTSSDAGKELLAHELVHTQQQKGGVERMVQRNEDVINNQKEKDAKSLISFKIFLHNFQVKDKDNTSHSLHFALGEIFGIEPDEVAALLPSWQWNNKNHPGYSAEDIQIGSATIRMDSSDYFSALDTINNNTSAKKALATTASKLYYLIVLDDRYRSFVLMQEGWVKDVYSLLAKLTPMDIAILKDDYKKRFDTNYKGQKIGANSLDLAAEIDSISNDFLKETGQKYIDIIKMMLGDGNSTMLSPVTQSEKAEPATSTRIEMKGGASTVHTLGTTASYSIVLSNNEKPGSLYTWYAIRDPRIVEDWARKGNAIEPFSDPGYIRWLGNSQEIIFKWDVPGAHKIVCQVTSTDKSIPPAFYAIEQFVYPNVKEFSDKQSKKELNKYNDAGISMDLLLSTNQAAQLRTIAGKGNVPEDLLMQYDAAAKSYALISEAIRSERIKAITPINGYPVGQEPVWVRQEHSWKNATVNDSLEQVKAAMDATSPISQSSPSTISVPVSIGKSFRNFFEFFYTHVRDKYTRTEDIVIEHGMKSKILYVQGIKEEDYYSLIGINNRIDKIPNTLESGKAILWQQTTEDFRTAERILDQVISYELDKKGKDKAKNNITISQLQNAGQMARNITGIYEKHPDAITIPAIFYPEVQSLSPDSNKSVNSKPLPSNFIAGGYRVFFYLYKDTQTNEWVLDDASPDSQGSNRLKIDSKETKSISAASAQSLFVSVDSKKRFPKGMLYYRIPNTGIENSIITTAPMELSDWLRRIGFVFMIASLPFALAGAAVAATILTVLGAGISIAGSIANMYEHDKQGILDQRTIFVDCLSIAMDILTLGLAGVGRILSTTTQATWLTKLAGRLYLPLKTAQLTTGGIQFLVGVEDLMTQLNELNKIEDKDKRLFAIIRIISTGIMMGTLHIVSAKGDWDDIASIYSKGKNIRITNNLQGDRVIREDFTDEVQNSLRSSDPEKQLEGKVGSWFDDQLVSFNRKVPPDDVKGTNTIGELDVELEDIIIEVTVQQHKKLPQVQKYQTNKELNPHGKTVILYSENYNWRARQSIEREGAFVAQSKEELFEIIKRIRSGTK